MYYIGENIEKENYKEFINYALDNSDFFLLVFSKKKNEGFKYKMKEIKKELIKLKVKSKFTYTWAGNIMSPNNKWEYQACYYNAESNALSSLLSVKSLFEWDWPLLPQDLCFYRKNQCWFKSVSHERLALLIKPTKFDIDFFSKIGFIEESNDYYEREIIIEEDGL